MQNAKVEPLCGWKKYTCFIKTALKEGAGLLLSTCVTYAVNAAGEHKCKQIKRVLMLTNEQNNTEVAQNVSFFRVYSKNANVKLNYININTDCNSVKNPNT